MAVDLSSNDAQQSTFAGDTLSTFVAGDILTNIENLIGSDHIDVLTGDDNDNIIDGGDGFWDGLDGGAGNDTISYARSDEGVNVILNNTSVDPRTTFGPGISYTVGNTGGHAQGDHLRNFENILGSAHNDTLTGDGGVNILDGAGGNDTLTGNGGADVFVAHILSGDTDTITDFTSGDKIRIDVDDPSAISDLDSLERELSLIISNNTDHDSDGNNDTILTFEDSQGGSDYLLVLDNFTTDLVFTDFEVI